MCVSICDDPAHVLKFSASGMQAITRSYKQQIILQAFRMLVLSTHNEMWFPGNGQPLTLVSTDVEGSTEVLLWLCLNMFSANVLWRL